MPKFVEETLAQSLPKATAGGEWDGDAPSDFEPIGPDEEIDVSEDEQEESEPEEGEEDEQPETEDPEEDEVEAADPEIEPEEEPDDEEPVTKGANKRIRQLAAQKKAAEDRLAQVLAQFQATQQQDLAFRQAQYQAQEQARLAQAQEQARKQRLQDLQANGLFDPQSKADQFALSLHQDFESQTERLTRLENQLQQAEIARQWQEYHSKVDSSLRASLKGYEIEDQDLAAFRQQVVAVAVANNLADPSIAVQHVVTPLLKFMQPKKRPAPVRAARVLSEDEKAAHRAVATRAPAGTKKKGQRVGGSSRPKNFSEALDEMYGETAWD